MLADLARLSPKVELLLSAVTAWALTDGPPTCTAAIGEHTQTAASLVTMRLRVQQQIKLSQHLHQASRSNISC